MTPLRHVLRALVLGSALLAPSAGATLSVGPARGDDEIVREFKRYFKKYKDTPTRVEAVLALLGTQSVDVVDALVPVLDDGEPEVVHAAVRVLSGFSERPPVEAIFAAIEEKSDPAVRAGLLAAVREGGYAGAAEALAPLLQDSSWDMRRRAIEALAAVADEGADALLAPLCGDREPAVRCAAFDGLALLGSHRVLEPARAALSDDSWQVRASAVGALARVRDRDSIGPLIDRMEVEEGRLVQDIGKALARITGRDFRDDVRGWRSFWDTYGDRFVMPTDAELERLEKARAEAEAQYTPPPGHVAYHGVDTPSRSILFVIDVSGSMEQEVNEKERFRAGEYPSFRRIDVVKTELSRTIEALESYVRFNVVAFATDVDTWKKDLVAANVLNKSSAVSWIGRLEAIGGASKHDLARVGLAGAANLEAGKTNTWGALETALSAAGQGLRDRDYELEVDTIFFLSDGLPSHGKYVETEDILREVNEANRLRKVVIHTIALGEFQKDFMRRLALENGGTFVDLGK